MKELSIEEKAKRYDEAIKLAKDSFNYPDYAGFIRADVVFPELAESKDEKIIKSLIGHLKECRNNTRSEVMIGEYAKWIAWLEKQGEQKPTDKAEPKFKVGDWVIDKQDIVHQIANVIENVTYHTYGYDIVGGGYFNDNTEGVRLWTIQDAKEGDVLAVTMYPEGTWIGILKEHNGCTFSSYCFVNIEGTFKLGTYNHGNGKAIHPATKEQRDLLFQKMHEAGYEWNAEKKELKKIEQKPVEWSEEDEIKIKKLITIFDELTKGITANITLREIRVFVDWLDNLKNRIAPQKQWKPSEEQILAINTAINVVGKGTLSGKHLIEILEQLKAV